MKQDVVIAGVGGQGLLTISGLIGSAALDNGLHVKQSEVHGMAYRGGRSGAQIVETNLRAFALGRQAAP